MTLMPVGRLLFKPLGPLLKFPLLSSFDGLPCDAFLFTGCFLKFILVPFPSAPLYKLAPHNLACVIAEDFVQDAFWFLGCPYHGLPLWIRWQDHSGKWCTENGNAPSQAVLRLGGRPNVCCAFDCAGSGLKTMPTPVPSLVLLMRPKYPRPSELCQASQEI